MKGLLDFARQTKPQRTLLDLNQVVEDVLALVRNQTVFRNITHRVRPGPAPARRSWPTPTRCGRSSSTSCSTPPRPWRRAASCASPRASNAAKKAVELRISDTGPGIPDEVRARIFEPFFTTKKTGTGLGLAVAYGIIERHHGEMRIDTARGRGTTFTISAADRRDGRR